MKVVSTAKLSFSDNFSKILGFDWLRSTGHRLLLVTDRYSESSLFRRFDIPKVRYCEGSLFRMFVSPKMKKKKRFVIPKVRSSENEIRFVIPKVRLSENEIRFVILKVH